MNQEEDGYSSKKTANHAYSKQIHKAIHDKQLTLAQSVRVQTLTDTHAYFTQEKILCVLLTAKENLRKISTNYLGTNPTLLQEALTCQYQPDRASTVKNKSMGLELKTRRPRSKKSFVGTKPISLQRKHSICQYQPKSVLSSA